METGGAASFDMPAPAFFYIIVEGKR
jgi:hypothetical protein